MAKSIKTKFLIALGPAVLLAVGSSWLLWNLLEVGEQSLNKIQEVNKLALESRIQLVSEFSGWRGTMLMPTGTKERSERLEANKTKRELLNKISALSKNEDILKLTRELIDFENKNLPETEEKLLGLVRDGGAKMAEDYFIRRFSPIRALYDELSRALVEVSNREVRLELEKRDQATGRVFLSIGLSLLGILFIFVLFNQLVWKDLRSLLGRIRKDFNEIWKVTQSVAGVNVGFSRGLSAQTTQVTESTESMNQMKSLILKLGDHAQLAEKTAAESLAKARRSQREIEKMSSAMSEIQKSNHLIFERVREGNSRVGRIVTVINAIAEKTKVINEIVFQTKLLSFNAAIEAARAGEHGKGFSVVAEEIGNLAAMSGEAAKQITNMLEGSIKEVETTILETKGQVETLIHSGQEKAAQGNLVALSCEESSKGLVESVDQVNQAVHRITEDNSDQVKGLGKLSGALLQVEKVARENMVESVVATSVAQDLKAQAEELNSFVKKMALLVEGSSVQSAKPVSPVKKPVAKSNFYSRVPPNFSPKLPSQLAPSRSLPFSGVAPKEEAKPLSTPHRSRGPIKLVSPKRDQNLPRVEGL